MPASQPLLAFLLALAAAAAAGDAPPFARLEKQMLELVNRDRAKHKLPALAWRDDVARVARVHSLDMKTHHFMDHKSPRTGRPADRLEAAKIPFRGAGENIASARTVRKGQALLMASPKHRKNVLSPEFTHLGVGIVRRGDGRLLMTQLFIQPPPAHKVAALRKRIVEGINQARAKRGLRRLLEDEQLSQRAMAHSERAARTEKPDPLWLEDRLAKDGQRWRVHEAAFFLTDDVAEVIACKVALSRRYDHFGIGVVQGDVRGKAKGALWVTLVCGQKK
ncbi:MAG: CAP domain-containing protein [Planctomycetota bacterium]